MITYVINTSENKTFDTEKLFSLVGYFKIVWMNSRLDEIEKCAEKIYDRQNVLGAEDFRIAIIVDFFNFKHIRLPYAETGYSKIKEEQGIDVSLYYPFIECYIIDHLYEKLTRRNIMLRQRDINIYYVRNVGCEEIENIDNAKLQLTNVLKADNNSDKKIIKEINENELESIKDDPNEYSSLDLLCTEAMSLKFKISDYPYVGDKLITKNDFFEAIIERPKKLQRHYFRSSNSGTTIMAAYDTLSLSLYLIEMYEQGKKINDKLDEIEDEEIPKIDPIKLKKVLIKSWNKICKAQEIAKETDTDYYNIEAIMKNSSIFNYSNKAYDASNFDEDLSSESLAEYDKIESTSSVDELYQSVKEYASHVKIGMDKKDIENLNKIISNYLENRDKSRAINLELEFDDYRKHGDLDEEQNITKKCPPRIVYEKIINDKEKEISDKFKNTLKSEYINVNYSEEKKQADVLMKKYSKLKEYQQGKPIATIIFCVIVCLLMLVPYALLQRKVEGIFNIPSIIFYLIHLGFFGGILFFSFAIQSLYVRIRLARIRRKMKNCVHECRKKHERSMQLFKKRYEEELDEIEEARYVIRLVKKFRDYNDQKEMHVKMHRNELESLENHLSSILNNLGIEAEVNRNINIDSEFNIDEPIKSSQNKVYKIFDIETIEDLFAKSNREETSNES